MRCFNHPATEAVGKGLCAQCAKETGIGITCSSTCEEEIKALRAMIDRTRKMYPFAPRPILETQSGSRYWRWF